MTTGTNFSEDIQIDAKSITGIRVFEHEDRVSIYTAKGEIFRGSKDVFGPDIDAALQVFQDAGAELFPFPVYGPEGRDHLYTSYIRHHAITFARVGESQIKGYKHVQIGVEGMPGEHSHAIGKRELKPFYEALQMHHGSMRHYEAPSVVIAGTDTTYVHAWLVTHMQARADNTLHIQFGAGNDTVDLPVCDSHAQRVAKTLYQEELIENGSLRAYVEAESATEMHAIMEVLAGDIACYTPHIFQVPNALNTTYLPKAREAWLCCAGGGNTEQKTLMLQTAETKPLALSLRFNTEADRKVAIQKISEEMNVRFVCSTPSCHP